MPSSNEPGPTLRPRSGRWQLPVLLAISAILNLVPFWWGATTSYTWAYDEVIPKEVLGGRPWRTVYPVFFRYVYRIALEPLDWLRGTTWVDWDRAQRLVSSLMLMRLLSVVLATLAVWLIYRSGRRLSGSAGGWISAAAVAFSPVFAYYAKTANLEAAYLFAYALFLLFAIRWLQTMKKSDAVLLGLTAALTVGIKDTAFALFPLLPVAFLFSVRRSRDRGSPPAFRQLLTDPGLWAGVASGGALLAILMGFPWDLSGFLRHFNRGAAMLHGSEREFANSLSGHLALFLTGIVNWAFVLGLPMSVAAILGVIRLWRKGSTRPVAAFLTLPAISYYLLFIMPIGFNPARYFLPLAFLAALAAGVWWHDTMASERRRRWVLTACFLVLGWSFSRTIAVDWLMTTDSRLALEEYVKNLPAPTRAVAFGRPQARPRISGATWDILSEGECAGLARLDADLIAVTPQDSWGGYSGGEQPMALLLSGDAGYRRLRVFARPALANWLVPPWAHSNLNKISPEVVLLRRTQSPCRDARWAMKQANGLLTRYSVAGWQSLLDFVANHDFLGRREDGDQTLLTVGLTAERTLPPGGTAILLFSNPHTARGWIIVKTLNRSAASDRPRELRIDSGYSRQSILLTTPRLQRLPLAGLAPHQRQMVLAHNVTPDSTGDSSTAIWLSGEVGPQPRAASR